MILGDCANGYAAVKPYLGWPEVRHLLAPYFQAAAAGAGWGLVMLVAPRLARVVERRSGGERRSATDRRAPQDPTVSPPSP
jgi:hypothetical protein